MIYIYQESYDLDNKSDIELWKPLQLLDLGCKHIYEFDVLDEILRNMPCVLIGINIVPALPTRDTKDLIWAE